MGTRLPDRIWYGEGIPHVLYMGVTPEALSDMIATRGTIPTGLLTRMYTSYERAKDEVGYYQPPIVLRVDSWRLAMRGALLIPREEFFLTNAGIPISLMERIPGNPMGHTMGMDRESLETMKPGLRKVVISIFDDDQRMVYPGDTVTFIDPVSGLSVESEVEYRAWFPSFTELYATYPKTAIGYEEDEEASPEDMDEFYTHEEQRKNGVVALEVLIKTYLSDTP